jgi:uncharacterized damage-inducible protein DinB
MPIVDPMIQEIQQEAVSTRKLLERVPEDKFAWKPHEKSFSLGQLASHLAESFEWVLFVMDGDEFVFDPAAYKPYEATDRADLLATFDRNLATAIDAMRGTPDDTMEAPWALVVEGNKVFERPRFEAVRDMSMSHTVHHRGQLTVYLRMNDVPLPAIYGPTADEQ